MLVIKLRNGQFAQLVKVGRVLFDPRPGWLLLGTPIGARKNFDIRWIHPDDHPVEWVRSFNFKEQS